MSDEKAWDDGYRQAMVAFGNVPIGSDPLRHGPPTIGPHANPYRDQDPMPGDTSPEPMHLWGSVTQTLCGLDAFQIGGTRVLMTAGPILHVTDSEVDTTCQECLRALLDAAPAGGAES